MKKIMIIDDELDILDVLDRFLSRSGDYDIEIYSNPTNAINRAKSINFDLVLSDIMMPQVSGLEILEQIKSSKPNTKVILMTAYTSTEKELMSKSLGVDGYLKKPFQNLREVETQIKSVLNI